MFSCRHVLQERGVGRRSGVRVLTLYGDMAPDEQDEVLRPNRRGTGGPRRVILSTPIAESSVTIDGVTAVVDSGLRRVPYYDASTAINRLVTVSHGGGQQLARWVALLAFPLAHRWVEAEVSCQSLQEGAP